MWDLHIKLEHCKVKFRTIVSEFSNKYMKRIDVKHILIINELSNNLHTLQRGYASDPSNPVLKYLYVCGIDLVMAWLELELDSALIQNKAIGT